MTDIAATLAALYETRRATAERITLLHLRATALAVRRVYPHAKTFDFYWSDQGGNEWHYRDAQDDDGELIPGSDRLDNECFELYLDSADHGVWAALCTDPDDYDDLEHSPDTVQFDIDQVLAATEKES